MRPEKFFVARGNETKGFCRTPHKTPRLVKARDVCGSCLNKGYAMVRENKLNPENGHGDEYLVTVGFWAPKTSTLEDYVERLEERAKSAAD
jgi:hypothetical protein